MGTSCSSSAGAISAKRHIDIRNILQRDTTLAIFCVPQVRFWSRRPAKVAAIALANKLARMAWAMMAKGERYRNPVALAA